MGGSATAATRPLANPVFARLFVAQVCSLLGVGLMTAALALLALRLGGPERAGGVLGLIFALKMVAYVGLAPVAEVLTARLRPARALVGLDLARLLLLLPMALAAHWSAIAALTFLFFAASAAFTPLFQSLIPEILRDEASYAGGLALSRSAATLETVLSPVLAGLALTLFDARWLFVLAALCLAGSVAALLAARPERAPAEARARVPFRHRLTRGLSIYLRTPRLRGLFTFNLALSLLLAWVLVNSGCAGRAAPGPGRADLSGADGGLWPRRRAGRAGGAAAAGHVTERQMMAGGVLAFAALSPLPLAALALPGLMLLWAGLRVASSLVLTPGGLVLARSAESGDRPAVFAAQFSLSHAGWLLAYPLAGWLGGAAGLAPALPLLGAAAALVALLGLRIWPGDDPLVRPHSHPDLPRDHPHLTGTGAGPGQRSTSMSSVSTRPTPAGACDPDQKVTEERAMDAARPPRPEPGHEPGHEPGPEIPPRIGPAARCGRRADRRRGPRRAGGAAAGGPRLPRLIPGKAWVPRERGGVPTS